ncbi:MAG TPA: tetratricopeptide repeat protein [Candidatus Acidoferrales bacterium]|nr:tetratricopeptide repeat protein [Candidatus Acidoferrales bacterium]
MRRALSRFLLCGLLLAPRVSAAQKNEPPDQAQDSEPQDRGSAQQDIDIGNFYMHKGDIDAAISRFEHAIRLQPNLGKARLLLGEAYERKGDKPAAVKCYGEYLQAFPKAPDAKKIQRKIERLSGK